MMAIHWRKPRSRPWLGMVADTGFHVALGRREEIDFLLVLSAGVYRRMGRFALAAYLPFANSNDLAERLWFDEILAAGPIGPAFIGLLPGDPGCELDIRLDRLRNAEVAGITNFPSTSLIDGSLRTLFEQEGCSLDAELDLLRRAKDKGLQAIGFLGAEPEAARRFAQAGLDALLINPGLTRTYEDLREHRDRLQEAIRRCNTALDEARAVDPDLPCLIYGGPIATPADLEQLYQQTAAQGFVGGSVFTRIPVESSVSARLRGFRGITASRGGEAQPGLGPLIGQSLAMRRLFALIERAAACDLNVLIEGESGVGKELVATQLHRLSTRRHGPLIPLNCGAIPDSLLESELFGHEKGAFTGADYRRPGKFELAHRGTLFLDEIGDLSPRGQVALLRAIQQREITRVGGNANIPVDNRILAASNRPLARLVQEGSFRADLYYRINQIALQVPPLRDRLDDLPLLVAPILEALRVQMKRPQVEIAPSFFAKLHRHTWPGNLRELQHALYQAALSEDGPMLMGSTFQTTLEEAVDRDLAQARIERVKQALLQANGNKSKAAQILGVTRKTLYAWMRE